MEKKVKVKSIPMQYGDAQIKCHKIYTESHPGDNDVIENTFHSHKYYECHFIENGCVSLRTGDDSIKIPQGEIIIIPPDFGHFAISPDGSFVSYVFEFSLECVDGENKGIYTFLKEMLDGVAVTPVKISPKLITMIKEFRDISLGDTIPEYCMAVAQVAVILSHLFNEISIYSGDTKLDLESVDLKPLIDTYINIPDATMEDIAKATSYSSRQISRIIRNLYGMSLSELRNQRRIQTAKELLKHTDYTIDRIALDSGFKSTDAMRKAFKKYENVMPSYYKRNKNN